MKIIGPVDERTLPGVPEAKEKMCIRCGHCEASCPSQAITLNFLPDEKVPLAVRCRIPFTGRSQHVPQEAAVSAPFHPGTCRPGNHHKDN